MVTMRLVDAVAIGRDVERLSSVRFYVTVALLWPILRTFIIASFPFVHLKFGFLGSDTAHVRMVKRKKRRKTPPW